MAHNTRQKTSFRLSEEMLERTDALTERDEYASRSDVIRDALQGLFAKFDFRHTPPRAHGQDRPGLGHERDIIVTTSTRQTGARLYSHLWDLRDDENQVVVFDEAGALDGLPVPPGAKVAKDRTELRRLLNETS